MGTLIPPGCTSRRTGEDAGTVETRPALGGTLGVVTGSVSVRATTPKSSSKPSNKFEKSLPDCGELDSTLWRLFARGPGLELLPLCNHTIRVWIPVEHNFPRQPRRNISLDHNHRRGIPGQLTGLLHWRPRGTTVPTRVRSPPTLHPACRLGGLKSIVQPLRRTWARNLLATALNGPSFLD